ncbi:MAG: hypothetical protein KA257_08980 [Opitutaceae bacterium]|nr:hypothetical protein [Opitutaceae bacterium]
MMKLNFFLTCALLTGSTLVAAPLSKTTAVFVRPDVASPTITFLKAGTEPVIAADSLALAPAGWQAVELPGPFEVYVQNKDIGKSLDVQTGTGFHLNPKSDSAVISTMAADDKATITGLHGKWTQISLDKKITGYIRGIPGIPSSTTGPVLTDVARTHVAAPSPAPVQPAAYGVGGAGQPAPMLNLGDGGSGALPRLFQGKFVSTKRAFAPRRPYDWQLNDDAGVRYAYLDISKLLLTEQIEKYIDHVVVVYGTPKPAPSGRDFVIQIESLQLK